MSLVKCRECGSGVSSKAKACPQCGAPVKRKHPVASGCLVVLVVVIFISIVGSCNDAPSGSRRRESGRPTSSEQKEKVPGDVRYEVIATNVLPGIKRSLDIRLSRKVSEDVLRTIALELRRRDDREYERTLICHYLPGMTVGAGAWATTHFNRDLEVRILGATVEQEERMLKEAEVEGEVIGKWFDEGLPGGNAIALYRQDKAVYMKLQFSDGSGGSHRMVERVCAEGRRYEQARGSVHGDYYLVDKDGNLHFGDNEGLFRTARKIK